MRHATFGHKHVARRKRRAVISASDLQRALFFIATAIVAAAIIKVAYQGIWPQPIAIQTPLFGTSVTPHDDICDNYNFNVTENIKGYSENSKIKNDCVSRQMGDGVGGD